MCWGNIFGASGFTECHLFGSACESGHESGYEQGGSDLFRRLPEAMHRRIQYVLAERQSAAARDQFNLRAEEYDLHQQVHRQLL
jgi:hypothetical protein